MAKSINLQTSLLLPDASAPLSVAECIGILNETLQAAVPVLLVEGEVGGFKLNHHNYVFFDIKDEGVSLGCFMMARQLRLPLEDGMRVRVVAVPRLTDWGKFSLTVKAVQPIGEGSLQRAYQLLKQKLEAEGLFAVSRKRSLPEYPEHVAVISSLQAAGFKDFIKIARSRWPLAEIQVQHVRVQGADAPDDIIAALETLNRQTHPPQAIALVRGGGSADDLACFNDEPLVRAIAASRVPVIAGIGHEVDETLAGLAADVNASTPSNAAELLLPDARAVHERLTHQRKTLHATATALLTARRHLLERQGRTLHEGLRHRLQRTREQLDAARQLLHQLDPETILRRGYAVVRDARGIVVRQPEQMRPGDYISVQLRHHIIESEVKHVIKR